MHSRVQLLGGLGEIWAAAGHADIQNQYIRAEIPDPLDSSE
jgi:hypothetical protein